MGDKTSLSELAGKVSGVISLLCRLMNHSRMPYDCKKRSCEVCALLECPYGDLGHFSIPECPSCHHKEKV